MYSPVKCIPELMLYQPREVNRKELQLIDVM